MIRFIFETVGGGVLFGTALLALAGGRRDSGRLSLVAGLGTLLLTIDEVSGGHERLGTWMYNDLGWTDPPVVNHWDDLIVIGIALAGMLTIAWLRAEVLSWYPFARWFGVGLALFAAAIAWDSRASTESSGSWYIEESLEMLAAACMAGAFALRLRWLRAAPTRAAASPSLLPEPGGVEL